MLKTFLAASAILVAVASVATAQKPAADDQPKSRSVSFGQLAPTPEMWFYDQAMEQYNDPRVAVRRAAEFNAQQRRNRLAAMRWFGFSNSRPVANPTPYTSFYSPSWSGNGANPYLWRGVSGQPYVAQPIVVTEGVVYGLW